MNSKHFASSFQTADNANSTSLCMVFRVKKWGDLCPRCQTIRLPT